jgi:hypothetical protein
VILVKVDKNVTHKQSYPTEAGTFAFEQPKLAPKKEGNSLQVFEPNNTKKKGGQDPDT